MAIYERPLRVLYIAHLGASGGAARSLQLLIKSLPRESVEAFVLSPPGPAVEGFREAGAQVLTIPAISNVCSIVGAPLRGMRTLTLLRECWSLRYGRTIRRAIEEVQPDLVHLNERGMYQAAHIAWRAGAPVVMHARSVADHSNPLVEALAGHYAKCVDRFIAIDGCVAQSMQSFSNCAVIYNPLPVETAAPRPTQQRNAVLTVGFLSGLLPAKGIWDLMEAAKILKHRRDIVFRVYGGNPRPKEFYRTWFGRACSVAGLTRDVEGDVNAWVRQEGLEATVQLLGHVRVDATLFHQLDVLAFPGHSDGVPRSVFEAGVFGVPSVITMRDDVQDIVQQEVTALITPPHDPPRFAQALVRLAEDESLRRRLGENARRKYLTQFDPQAIGQQTLRLYQEVLQRPTNRSERRAA